MGENIERTTPSQRTEPTGERKSAATRDDDIETSQGQADTPRPEIERDNLMESLKQARKAELIATRQRDALRLLSRTHLLTVQRLRSENARLVRAASESADAAAEWESRYFGLRARLESALRRFWILRAGRMVPPSVRTFVRERILGPRKQS